MKKTTYKKGDKLVTKGEAKLIDGAVKSIKNKVEESCSPPIILEITNPYKYKLKGVVIFDTAHLFNDKRKVKTTTPYMNHPYSEILMSLFGKNIHINKAMLAAERFVENENNNNIPERVLTVRSKEYYSIYQHPLCFLINKGQQQKNLSVLKINFYVKNLFSITIDELFPKERVVLYLYPTYD